MTSADVFLLILATVVLLTRLGWRPDPDCCDHPRWAWLLGAFLAGSVIVAWVQSW